MRSYSERTPEIADHTMIRCIGGGNYGNVWLAQNIMGTFRAIKVVHRKHFKQQRPYDREFTGIMKYEPVSRSHPGLVSVLHIGSNVKEQYFYYIMEVADDVHLGRQIVPERYEPKTLAAEKGRNGRLPVAECLRIGLRLSAALSHLHRSGLVHRDLKPSNIIFVEDDPKLADIGLVTDVGESSTFVGSEGYVPLEGPGKPTADLYGLGKVLFEIVTGQHHLHFPKLPQEFDQLSDVAARRMLMGAITQACEMNPNKRFQTARELQHRLQAIQDMLGETAQLDGRADSRGRRPPNPKKVVILGDTESARSGDFARRLEYELARNNCQVFADQSTGGTIEWAREVEARITDADAVIPLLSPESLQNELLADELRLAQDQAQRSNGKPQRFPVLLEVPEPLPPTAAEMVAGATRLFKRAGAADPDALVREIAAVIHTAVELTWTDESPTSEPLGGAVLLDSPFYIKRPADAAFHAALAAGESLVLIKGARQMGKTSLLARGLQRARSDGLKVILTDYQKLNAASLESIENLYFALGSSLADQLDLAVLPEDVWDSRRSPNLNLERYLKREVLQRLTTNLVWGMDEIDRLFPCPFSGEVFGLFRSWHNTRALEPASPWSRLTLALAYATEANLFIADLSESPFNVGLKLELKDFDLDQVAEMNRLYGSPLKTPEELASFWALLGGQPYLSRRGLHELAAGRLSFDEFGGQADKEEGIFGDHLRRLVVLLARDAALVEAAQKIVQGQPCPNAESFHRLRSAGMVAGTSPSDARFRCQLYQRYLARNL